MRTFFTTSGIIVLFLMGVLVAATDMYTDDYTPHDSEYVYHYAYMIQSPDGTLSYNDGIAKSNYKVMGVEQLYRIESEIKRNEPSINSDHNFIVTSFTFLGRKHDY